MVVNLDVVNESGTPKTYLHLGREGRTLPKFVSRSNFVEDQAQHSNSLYYLACCYLVLISSRDDDKATCYYWLNLLDSNMQDNAQQDIYRAPFSPTLYHRFNEKARVIAVRQEQEPAVVIALSQ
jgi:hypothetical protein